jgi:hypothetical protein
VLKNPKKKAAKSAKQEKLTPEQEAELTERPE